MKRKSARISVRPERPLDAYYESISERFGITQVLLYLSLLVFVVLSLIGNTGLLTYQNFYYFFKDLGASAETVDVLHTDALSYPTDSAQSFTLYRQGLAIAGNTSVTVFTPSGRQAISQKLQYDKPTAEGSGKYLLVYDADSTQYSLYTSYAQVRSGKSRYPIRSAAVSASGAYLLLSASDEFPSEMELYDDRFERIGYFTLSSYVTDVAINRKGTVFAFLASEVRDGAFATSIRIYETGRSEPVAVTSLGNGLGLSCSFTDNGNLSVICGDGVYIVSPRGNLLNSYAFDGKTIRSADENGDGCALILAENDISSKKSAIVFDKSGKIVYNEAINETAGTVRLCGDAIFLQCSDGIERIRTDNGHSEKFACVTDGRFMLAYDETCVLLCSSKRAVFCRFGN